MALHIPPRKWKKPLFRKCPNIIHFLRRGFSLQLPYFAMTSTCLRRIMLEKHWLEEQLIYFMRCSKMRGALVARHRLRKQVSIKAKLRKTTYFWATVSWQRHVYSAVVCDGQFEKVRTPWVIKWLETLEEENWSLLIWGFFLAQVCQDSYFQ